MCVFLHVYASGFVQLARQAPPSTGRPAGAGGGRKPILVWLRADLRLHDHEALAAACKDGSSLMPVYVFDPREYGQVRQDLVITGAHTYFVIIGIAIKVLTATSSCTTALMRPPT